MGALRTGDVLVLHEGWVLSNVVAAIAARFRSIAYVVVPHGVYEPGILASLRGPMRLRRPIERWVLEGARGIHVFWASEAPLVHAIAPRARVFVAPTGFEVPGERWEGGGGYIAWLGRFDPVHKGLDTLLDALWLIEPAERPVLRLHGPDYNGGLEVVRGHARRLGLDPWVRLGGPVHGEEKKTFLRRADAYVHPSRWESHSIALLECLALGIPSVVSAAIHIAPALSEHAAAIVVPPTPEGLADGLRRVRAHDGTTSAESGRAFVETQLDWDVAVAAFVAAATESPRQPLGRAPA